MFCDAVRQLRSGPSARAFGDLGADRVEHGWSEGRLPATTRLVGQGVEPVSEEGFDPGADGLLVLAEVARNLGHTPACVGEPHHLESIASGRGNPVLASALAKFLALRVSQGDTVHEAQDTESYELWPPSRLDTVQTRGYPWWWGSCSQTRSVPLSAAGPHHHQRACRQYTSAANPPQPLPNHLRCRVQQLRSRARRPSTTLSRLLRSSAQKIAWMRQVATTARHQRQGWVTDGKFATAAESGEEPQGGGHVWFLATVPVYPSLQSIPPLPL